MFKVNVAHIADGTPLVISYFCTRLPRVKAGMIHLSLIDTYGGTLDKLIPVSDVLAYEVNKLPY